MYQNIHPFYSTDTLTFLHFRTLTPQNAQFHLAKVFGTRDGFQTENFCKWYKEGTLGNDNWFKLLPVFDQKKVLMQWSQELPSIKAEKKPQNILTEIPQFLPEFTMMADNKNKALNRTGRKKRNKRKLN